MPLHPTGGKLLMPVETEADVRAVFEKALVLSQTPSRATRQRYHADIEDHFYYIGAICPQHFRPLQEEMVSLPGKELAFFQFTFATWLYLLQDAPQNCVEQLWQRLLHPEPECPLFVLEWMLAAIGTPAALSAMAEYAQRTDQPHVFRDLGFWLPGKGKSAEPRFTRSRWAVRLQPLDASLPLQELMMRPHPVGLSVPLIAESAAQEVVTWHYLTLDLTRLAGFPPTAFSRIHLVSPPYYDRWTLFCTISPHNRYTQAALDVPQEEDRIAIEQLRQQARDEHHEGRGELLLLPYDDRLVYRNGHTQGTEGVYGDVGGPPIALDPLPCCPICHKLMFHACVVACTLREYGDGLRSLFFCEQCLQVASQGMGWG